ncbi:inorganic diphosphatase [Candidatus Saccharibacteria bacterium]|nr:inorganic diphosphatase [Candidatus Saccharibacteria bacterium]
MDWNQVLDAGDVQAGEINVVIEISKGSNNKVEWNRRLKVFEIDRIEPAIFPKPTNYGFIPQTLDEDGDELDVLVITNDALPMNTFLKARVLGVMKFTDDGEVDDKIICVPVDDRDSGNSIKTLKDVPEQLIKQIEHHFNHYKDLKKPGSTIVQSFDGLDEAKQVIASAIDRWRKQ